MSRLLLSLWLLGAALYTANTLIYANVIFGWSTTKQKIHAGNAGTETAEPSAGTEANSQQSANTSAQKDPVPKSTLAAQPSDAEAATALSDAGAPVSPIQIAPQERAQQPQGESEMVRVSGSPAAMRSGPSDSAPMLFGFPEGRELRVMSRQPGWVQVIDPGSKQSGWIAEDSLAASGQQQQTAAGPQRPSRDAGPQAYDSAEGLPPGARGAWVPWEEDGIEEPQDQPRGRGHRRNGAFAGILRRAFSGY